MGGGAEFGWFVVVCVCLLMARRRPRASAQSQAHHHNGTRERSGRAVGAEMKASWTVVLQAELEGLRLCWGKGEQGGVID